MKDINKNLDNKHTEVKGIQNNITKLLSTINSFEEKIREKFNKIKSNIEFNEEIMKNYEEWKLNYYIIDNINNLKFTMDDENLKLDELYEEINKIKLIGENNMWISEKYCNDWG